MRRLHPRHRTRRAIPVALAAFVLAGVTAAAAPAPDASTSRPAAAPIDPRAWNEVAKGAEGTVWVILREQANLRPAFAIADWDQRGAWVYETLVATAERTQTGLRRLLAARGIEAQSFFIVNALALHGADAETLRVVAARSEVERIEGDPKAFIEPDATAADATAADATTADADAAPEASGSAGTLATEWGVSAVNAPSVWSTYGTRGEGIVVGTIDTGVLYTHAALVKQYRGNTGTSFNHDYDWYDPTGTCTSAPCDNNGHGTHTMGTIAGEDGTNRIGVAPGVRWIAAKGCATSSCSSSALLSSGQWMLAPTTIAGGSANASLRPQVVSNSWGSNDGSSTVYQKMVDSWVASGIFPVFSNGNAGPSCSTVGSPGSYLAAFGVGAYDSGGSIASFSSRGPSPFSSEVKPDISAPGVNVRSAWNNGSYNTISGTSMAAPHVAGAVALVLAAAPSLIGAIAETKSVLTGAANRTGTGDRTCGGTNADNNVWGNGKLDAYAAVTAAPRGATGTLSGTVTDSATGAKLAGVSIAVSGPSSRTTTTDSTGGYSLLLPVGTYGLTATRFAYDTRTLSGIVVNQGATTTGNATLVPQPTYTLTGTLTGPTGSAVAGAKVEVSAPVAPVTSSNSGSFSVGGLPATSYTLTATPVDRCLATATQTVSVGATSTAANIGVPARTDGFGHICVAGSSASFISGSTKAAITGDDATGSIALPFSFPYYGKSYSTAYLSTNGFLSFASLSSAYWASSALPTSGAPNGIYPFWTDLVVDSNAGIYTATLGTAPSRRFVIEWRNVAFYGSSGRATFGVVLSEGTGEILLEYTKLSSGSVNLGSSATVGIERADGGDALQYSSKVASLQSGLTIAFR